MPGSREQLMLEMLKELRADSSGVEAAVLISSDAMPLASDVSDSTPEEVICATASALISASEKAARNLARGNIGQIYLRGDDGDVVVVKVNDFAILACTVDRQAKMGITLMEVARCAQKLTEVI